MYVVLDGIYKYTGKKQNIDEEWVILANYTAVKVTAKIDVPLQDLKLRGVIS
jgi:hypothetical protein